MIKKNTMKNDYMAYALNGKGDANKKYEKGNLI
jgi:hypothetical protein